MKWNSHCVHLLQYVRRWPCGLCVCWGYVWSATCAQEMEVDKEGWENRKPLAIKILYASCCSNVSLGLLPFPSLHFWRKPRQLYRSEKNCFDVSIVDWSIKYDFITFRFRNQDLEVTGLNQQNHLSHLLHNTYITMTCLTPAGPGSNSDFNMIVVGKNFSTVKAIQISGMHWYQLPKPIPANTY